jgi:hypothetical protein
MAQLYGDLTRVYIETGRKHTFAGAIDWPGWCRMGQDENSALMALFEIGPRYAAVLQAAQIEFQAPLGAAAFKVVERLEGNATTDFGAPNIPPSNDNRLVSEDEFLRLQALVMACWQALDSAVIAASGRELRKGPRGVGRDLAGILEHIVGSDASDLARLAWKFQLHVPQNSMEELGRIRQATLNALARSALGQIPEQGWRSGVIWTPRHFVRNLAWHTLDHTWEIEDRIS